MNNNAALSFLNLLWPDANRGTLAIHLLPSNKTHFFDLSSEGQLKAASALAGSISKSQNVYHTMGLLNNAPQKGRGSISDVIGLPGVWMDIDCISGSHKKNSLPATTSDAMEFLRSFELPPTVIVSTGNGLHPYWLFDQIRYFENQKDRFEAVKLSELFQNHIIAKGREHGWELDKTSDIVRILRIPGTYNLKNPKEPKAVSVLGEAKNRYAISEIEKVAVKLKPHQKPISGNWSKAPEGVPQGERNTTLFKYAMHLLGRGLTQAEAWPLMKIAADKCKPPLPESETKIILKSATKRQASHNDKPCRIPSAQLVEIIKSKMALIHDGANFYSYNDKGLWVQLHDNQIAKKMKDELGGNATSSKIADAMKLLEADVYKTPKQLFAHSELVNLLNGMLDIKEMKLLKHDPKYLSRSQVPIEYDPNAKAPRFLQFLAEIFADAPSKAITIQDFAGYTLFPGIFIHECLFLIGNGANGKSVLVNTLAKLVGEENACSLDLHQLSNRFMIVTLKDKLLNIATEMQASTPIDEGVFKRAIGGDWIQAEEKFKDPIKFRPIAKHIFSMNEPPTITDRTLALKRRLIVIKFSQSFGPGKEDKFLEGKLASELSGIFNWAIEGLQRVMNNQAITTTPEVLRDKSEFIRAIDHLRAFVEECCVISEKEEWARSALYKRYSEWAAESGFRRVSNQKFYRYLEASYPISLNTYGQASYRGIGLEAGGM
jgi:P4 family phage/plasmid primase-like protien